MLINMKSSLKFHPCSSVSNDHSSEEEGKGSDHRKEGQVFVSVQSSDVKTDRDQAGEHHGDLPHDVALPVSAVVDH